MTTKKTKTPWGPIGYITAKRTYMRKLNDDIPDSPTEEWPDAVKRIVDACNNQLGCEFTKEDNDKIDEILTSLKGSVAGRFWWQLGTKTVDQLGLFSLQNCAGVVVDKPVEPFCWTMDALMLGSGVGYNIQREFVYELPKPKKGVKITRQDTKDADFIVPDSREGWVELLRRVLTAHYYTGESFSYSTICIRGKGAPIKRFGGVASGPEELCWGMGKISELLNDRAGKKMRPIDCLDIMNIIGYIVVAGNVRRSAQIAIGDCDDRQFLKAKRWDLGKIPNWRAMSNNSVVCNDFNQLLPEFWHGYEGKGEPYGLINLKLSKQVGRLGETEYPDINVQVYNPCVTGDTKLLTKKGLVEISSLTDKSVDIWNGYEWSKVIPKITGKDQKIIKIGFDDGRKLKCTPYHKFHIQNSYTKGDTKVVEGKDLKLGDKLIKCEYPVIYQGNEVNLKEAYTQGFYSADGVKDRNTIWLYEPKYILEPYLNVRQIGNEYINRVGVKRKSFRSITPLNSKTFVPFDYSVKGRLAWLSGLLDGDGTELKEGGSQLGSIDRKFLVDVQSLLTTLGVNSKIVKGREEGKQLLPDQKGNQKEYYCQRSYRLCIGAVEMQDLKRLGLTCRRLKFDKVPNRNASRFTKVTSISSIGTAELVYCFNELKKHLGVFDGVITGQCAEQSLANYETCCLAEIPLPLVEGYNEFLEILKYLYIICKHSLRLKCHQKETEEIVHKNMRMGLGITGELQATEEQLSWLSKAYVWMRDFDKEYSAKKGWPTSVKLTTVKPSGTISLLSGVTPGCHPGFARYFIRRMRIAADSKLVGLCRKNGYLVEPQRKFDGTPDHNTFVVEFPCSYPEHTKFAADMSAVAQLENVKFLQQNWSDNSVSCTIYYKKEELEHIKKWLAENYNTSVKTCSFLLHQDHGFDQAPFEEISEKEYNKRIAKVKPIESVEVSEEEMEIEECAGGACPIK